MPVWLLTFFSRFGLQALKPLALVALLGVGAYFIDLNGYHRGFSSGYAKSLKDNPPNIYNGTTTVNQQPCDQASVLGISIGKWGFGFIKK